MKIITPENNRNLIDRLFRKRLHNQEIKSNPDIWSSIENSLDQENNTYVRPNYWYSIMLIALLIGTALNVYTNHQLLLDENDSNGVSISSDYTALEHSYRPGSTILYEHRNSFLASSNNYFAIGLDLKRNKPLVFSDELASEKSNRGVKNPEINKHNRLNSGSGNSIGHDISPGTINSASKGAIIAVNESGSIYQEKLNSSRNKAKETAEFVSMILSTEVAALELESTDVDFKNLSQRETEKLRDELMGIKGFHIGPEGSISNTWVLLKDKSIPALEGYDLDYKFNHGYSMGISAGYDFSARFGLQLGWTIHSKQGQKFVASKGNLKLPGEIELKYTQVPLMMKYKWSKISDMTKKPVVMNYIFGLQYSRLKSSSMTLAGEQMDTKDLFNKDELGILFGIDYDIFLSEKYFVSLGLRGSLSSDINSFPLFINEENSNPYNFLLGATVSFKYLARRNR